MKKLFLSSQFSDVVSKFEAQFATDMGKKRVGFVPLASAIYDDPWWMRQDRESLEKAGFSITNIDPLGTSSEDLGKQLDNVDIIFVAGGNTFYLLQELKRTGADAIFVEQIHRGKIYVGSSAGSIITGPTLEPIQELDEPEGAPELKGFDALGVVDFVVMPHMENPKFEPIYRQGIVEKYESRFILIPITDNQAVVVKGDEHFVV